VPEGEIVMQATNTVNVSQNRPEYGFILVRILGAVLFFGSLFLLVQNSVS
jgi:hypothetical protein